jgi:hypothetical protein
MVHQLTPYVLLLQLGTLTFAGFVRPRWLFWACLTITIAYLLPNLAWVNEHFGLFSSFDPFNNVKRPGSNTTLYECKNACKVVFSVSMLAAVVAWLGAMAAIITIARRLPSFRLPLYGLSLFAPFLILLGQNYGGEAGVRVIMFTSPFAAILIAAGITATRGTVRLVLCILTVFILANGFSYAYFGSEQSRFVTRDEVRSAQYLYANAPKESMIIEAAPNYPVLTAGNYFDFKSGADGLFGDVRLLNKPLGPAQVPFVIDDIEKNSPDGFVIFSPQMAQYAEAKGATGPNQLDNLQKAMLASGRFKIWHRDGDVVIYRLIPQAK